MGHAGRGALLHRFADLIEANAELLALADSTDMGKPVSDARTRDVPRTAANYRFFADHARLATGDVLPMVHRRVRHRPGHRPRRRQPGPVSLELGGKGANIVFDDAALDNAVDWSIKAVFSNAGQLCLAGSRLYVQRGSYGEFLDRFTAAAQALVVGRPEGPGHPTRPAGLTGALQEGPFVPGRHRAQRRHYPHRRSRRGLGHPAHDRRERPAHRPRLPRGGLRPGRHRHPFDTDEEAIG